MSALFLKQISVLLCIALHRQVQTALFLEMSSINKNRGKWFIWSPTIGPSSSVFLTGWEWLFTALLTGFSVVENPRLESRTSCMQTRCSTSEQHPLPISYKYFIYVSTRQQGLILTIFLPWKRKTQRTQQSNFHKTLKEKKTSTEKLGWSPQAADCRRCLPTVMHLLLWLDQKRFGAEKCWGLEYQG